MSTKVGPPVKVVEVVIRWQNTGDDVTSFDDSGTDIGGAIAPVIPYAQRLLPWILLVDTGTVTLGVGATFTAGTPPDPDYSVGVVFRLFRRGDKVPIRIVYDEIFHPDDSSGDITNTREITIDASTDQSGDITISPPAISGFIYLTNAIAYVPWI